MEKKAKYEVPETSLVYERSMKKATEDAPAVLQITVRQSDVAEEVIQEYQERADKEKIKKERHLLLEKSDLVRYLLKHYKVVE